MGQAPLHQLSQSNFVFSDSPVCSSGRGSILLTEGSISYALFVTQMVKPMITAAMITQIMITPKYDKLKAPLFYTFIYILTEKYGNCEKIAIQPL